MTAQNKRLTGILLLIGLLLLIPLVAMQFTDEVNWRLSDFVVAGMLLLAPALLFELVIRKVRHTGYRIAISLALIITVLLIWAELAVGIFGTPFAGS